jgi:hypothetical protein
MTTKRTNLAGWGSTGKTRTTAHRHRRYNVRAAHRTRLGTGGALRRGVGWVRFCTAVLSQKNTYGWVGQI